LLIVEDEEAILQGLTDLFVFHGYAVESSRDGRQALEMARHGDYDLVILDVMLPSVDGFTICHEIRRHDRAQPVMMLTAKTMEEDVLTGLTLGADDYISKPFSVRELLLRVEAVLRRSQKLRLREHQFVVGDGICIDVNNLVGHHAGTASDIPFTRREIDILQYLRQHADRPISREELLVEVWGYERADAIETRTVDIHIAKLRRKIEPDPKNPVYLGTIRGEGYQLHEQPGST
jgi:two-component system response regulator RegX3